MALLPRANPIPVLSRKRVLIELVVIVLLFAGFVAWSLFVRRLSPIALWTASCVAFLYFGFSWALQPGLVRTWGIRVPDRDETMVIISGLGLALAFMGPLVLISHRLADQGLAISLQISPSQYLFWALAQDLIFFSIIARHIKTLGAPNWLVAILVGLLFGASHLPDLRFSLVTAAGGTFLAWLFIRSECLIPVVAAHWLLGMCILSRPDGSAPAITALW